MPAIFSATNQSVSVSAADLVLAALLEIDVAQAGEPLDADDGAWGLQKLQRLIDQFNARREIIFSVGFVLFTTQANHAPHTIGPTGDFAMPLRPVRISSASFILSPNSGNPVDTPITIRDKDWWAANPLKSLTTSIITDLYYDPAQSNGNLNFYPICNVANPVRLEIWNNLQQAISLNTTLGFVQGYWDAIVLSLAVNLWASFWKTDALPSSLQMQQKEAMRVILDNNDPPPRIVTNEGMPGSNSEGRPDFNFLTGLRE